MSDESGKRPDPGFLTFRAATALAQVPEPEEAGGRRIPPPLPPPPPGAAPVLPGPAPDPVAVVPAPASPPPTPPGSVPSGPPIPAAGVAPAAAWELLSGWCVAAGVASGGLLADPQGTVVASGGAAPPAAAGELVRALAAAGEDARRAGGEGSAAALDLGGTWATGLSVPGPHGPWLAVLWGRSPLRGALRAALGAWLLRALAR